MPALRNEAAGLGVTFLQTLITLRQTPFGMCPEEPLSAEHSLQRKCSADCAPQLRFFAAVEERLRHIPGVQGVAVADAIPPEGRPDNTGSPTGGMVVHRQVTLHYFSILGIKTVRGRAFAEEDSRRPRIR